MALRLLGVDTVALLALQHDSLSVGELVGLELELHVRVGDEVVVPVRVGVRASLGSEDAEAAAVLQVSEWVR